MKQDWEIKSISDVCLSLDDGDWIEKKNQSAKGIRLIQTGNIGCGEYRDKSEKAKYISEETFRTLKCTEVVAGDILVSRLPDPVGRACIVPYLSTKCITAVDCSIVKLNPKIISAKWFIYYTLSAEYKTKVIAECSGTTRDRISRKKLSVISLPIPPLAEQERMVEILDREFERIDALKVNAERNLQHAKDLFQAALRQELQPKEGWITMQIGNVCELKQGLAINAKTKYLLVEKSQLPLLRIKDLKDGTREIFVNESECPQGCRAYPEDIIYTRTGTLGLVFTGAYGVMHNNCFKIEIDKEKIDKYYLMYYLQQDSFRNNIIKLASRAAQPDITHKLFKEQIIHFPTIAEQVAIIHKLSDIREHCTALEDNYKKTIALCDDMKQALLKQAFNGEL